MTKATKTTKTAITLVTGTADLLKGIASIQKRGKRLDADIQLFAVSVLNHLELHGDVMPVRALCDAMPKGSRLNALKEYLCTFGKLQVSEDESLPRGTLAYDKQGKTDLQGAMDNMWYDFRPEKPFVMYSLTDQLTKMLDGYAKKLESGKAVVHSKEFLEGMAQLLQDEQARQDAEKAMEKPSIEGMEDAV